MVKTIVIDEKEIEINTSAGWLYKYRNRFGHDILPDLMPIIESVLTAIGSILEETGGIFDKKSIGVAMNNDALVDAFIKMAGMEVITLYNIFWAMAANQNKTIAGPEDYFNQFERFPLDEIIPEMFKAIVDSSVSSKNAERLLTSIKEMRTQESTSTSSQSQEPIED